MRFGFVARLRACALVLAVVGASSLVLAGAASAKTYNANNTAQLEKAVGEANANTAEANTIVLTSVGYLPTAALTITNTKGLTFEGPTSSVWVEGRAADIEGTAIEPELTELFIVNSGVPLTFKNVEVAHAGGSGAPAIRDYGTVHFESSLLVGNIGTGVLVESSGTLTATNTTISDGIGFGVISTGTASFFNSTVAFNEDGGIANQGTVNLTNTIVADNEGAGDCKGAATTSDHSLDSNGSCGVGALSGKNPLLSPLVNDGGPTAVHFPEIGSPAIGAGDPATCTKTDQRGAPRSTPCTIGAAENGLLIMEASFTEPPEPEPNAVAVDTSGNIWVGDSGNDRVVEFNSNRKYIQQFGSQGSGAGQFNGIGGIAYDPVSGDVYVTDPGNHDVQYFTTAGKEVGSFGTLGLGEGDFITPTAIAIDSSGNVWVLNSSGLRVQEFTSAGKYVTNSGFGSSFATPFLSPSGMTFSGGNLYVTESTFGRVVELTTAGAVLNQFGSLDKPSGIATDPTTGNLYVTELGTNSLQYNGGTKEWAYVHSNNRVQEFSPSGTFMTAFGSYGPGAGQFSSPRGVAVSSSHKVYVADTGNQRIEQWRLP